MALDKWISVKPDVVGAKRSLGKPLSSPSDAYTLVAATLNSVLFPRMLHKFSDHYRSSKFNITDARLVLNSSILLERHRSPILLRILIALFVSVVLDVTHTQWR